MQTVRLSAMARVAAFFQRPVLSGRMHSLLSYATAVVTYAVAARLPLFPVWRWFSYVVSRNPTGLSKEVIALAALWGPRLWYVHFARRILEVLYVHEYRRKNTMLDMLFAATSYMFYGICVANTVRPGAFSPPDAPAKAATEALKGFMLPPKLSLALGLLLFSVGELGNAWSHLQLRWSRQKTEVRTNKVTGVTTWSKPQGKVIMSGGLFNYVTCAHYFYEILTWAGYLLCTQGAGGAKLVYQWSIGGLAIMAYTRHSKYRAYFDGKDGRAQYPPNRKALIPFLL